MLFKSLGGVGEMNDHRKKIIISEIKYWKKNKLLPAHYCDFLITLYARGNEMDEEDGKVSTSILSKEKKKKNVLIIICLLLAFVLSVGLFMFEKYPSLLLGFTGIILSALLLYPVFNQSIKKSSALPFIYISSAMILLAMSFKLWTTFFYEVPMLLLGLLILNCVLWLFAGRKLKLLYFTLSGAVGIVFIIGFLIYQI